VGDPFGGEEEQSQNRESNLEALRVEFLLCDWLNPPLSCGFVAEAANFPDDIEIDDGAEEGESHHGDADGVLMEAAGRRMDSGGCGESAEADRDAKTTDGDDGGAGTLEDGENDAGAIDEFWIEGHGRHSVISFKL